MKPSYMRFINRVSDNKADLFNRPLFRGFFQRLDDEQIIKKALDELRPTLPEHTSNYYKEKIISWINV